jgi:hypothetical protein
VGLEPLADTEPVLAEQLVERLVARFFALTRLSREHWSEAIEQTRIRVLTNADGSPSGLEIALPLGSGNPGYEWDGTMEQAMAIADDAAEVGAKDVAWDQEHVGPTGWEPEPPGLDVKALITEVGVEELARRYVAGEDESTEVMLAVVFGDDEHGDPLPMDLWWQIGIAALHACPDDDGALWSLGDGTFDHMRAHAGIDERLLAERRHDPKVARLFEAMRRQLPNEGVTEGFWFQER